MTILLFLPAGDADYRWMRIAGGAIAGEGEGLPDPAERIVAVAPADAVTLHWADLPSRSSAQATAAARILAAQASAGAIGDLHVAAGDEGAGERPIAVVAVDAMHGWLATLAGAGIEPAAIVPAALLLPRPDSGFVRARIAGFDLVRGRATGFADEPGLTEVITGGDTPVALDDEAVRATLVAAADAPVLDLRQGAFARRGRRSIDWRLIRRLALLGLGILALTLAIDLVRIVRYGFAADAVQRRADALARTGLPRGETINDADRQLDERLSRVRGPGLGYSTTVATLYEAVRATPGTEITALDFQANGDVRLGVACEREALATDLKAAMEARGLLVRAGVFAASAGRVTGELTVTAP
ncbi:MAG TPA: type II secretion system protein GspL [Sphingomonas sp.]|nr:type II secretion system protein GspL [Sphingomonas sp.]